MLKFACFTSVTGKLKLSCSVQGRIWDFRIEECYEPHLHNYVGVVKVCIATASPTVHYARQLP